MKTSTQSCRRRGLGASLGLALAVLALQAAPVRAAELIVGVVPQFEAKRLHEIWDPILEQLASRTGDTYTIKGNSSIPEFESSLARGEFDIVYANPWHAVIANEQQGYLPVIKDGSRKLKGILVVGKNSDITDVRQLDGKEIAFPAPNALGASLLMRADLKTLFGLNITPVYVDTHSSVYLNVALGSTSAGGGVKRTLLEQPQNLQDRLRVLYETRPMNPHPICVHPRLQPKQKEAFVAAFMAMSSDETSNQLLSDIPISQAAPASLDDYTVLKTWGLREFYVTE